MEKKTSSANRLVLKRILGQEGNSHCADCKIATHPRWASWNIGILICIRCSGIHRSLGTHISKVRSIDLDTWNDMQLEKLVEFGNARANAFWEAKLPPNYVPDESKIVNFIKTKYELRRWIPDDDDKPLAAAPKVPPRVRDPPTSSVDLLDLDGAFNMKSGAATRSAPAEPLTSTASAPPPTTGSRARPQTHRALPETPAARTATSSVPAPRAGRPAPNAGAPAPHTGASAGTQNRNDVKKSILSLYSQPQQQTPAFASPAYTSPAYTSPAYASPSFTPSPSVSPAPAASLMNKPQEPAFADEDDDEDNFAHVWN